MNDDFLHRIRKEPAEAFVIALKAKLDKQREMPRGSRPPARLRYVIWLSLFGTAALASSLFVTYVYRQPSVSSVTPAAQPPLPQTQLSESSTVAAPAVNTPSVDSSETPSPTPREPRKSGPARQPSTSTQRTAKRFETAGAPLVAAASKDASVDVLDAPTGKPAPTDERSVSSAAPESSADTITAPAPPSAHELLGDSLHDFILHHATTHYVDTSTVGDLARWRGGQQSICPITEGLSAGYNAFVNDRIRAIASYVGAPVDLDMKCKSNVQIQFTNNPEERMDSIFKWATGPTFRTKYLGGRKDLLAFTQDHAVQGWYVTTSGGAVVLNRDVSDDRLDVQPLWPRITQNYSGSNATGSRLRGGSGTGSGIGIVILVVNKDKVSDLTVGTISDYLAMLALSVAQNPDHCDSLPSILDLMSTGCGVRDKATAMTAGDLAFLKALYYRNTGLGPSLSRSEIRDNMIRQFKLQ